MVLSVMAEEKKEYIILWFIENYSYCWHKWGEKLVSPLITPNGLKGTSWNLRLYPRKNGKISISMVRNDTVPEKFSMKFEPSVIAADGSPLTIKKSQGSGFLTILDMEEVLLRRKDEYLPQDTLSVRGRMWQGEGDILKVEHFSVRTRIGIEKVSFLHKVANFSALKPNERKTICIRLLSKSGCDISSRLFITENSCSEGTLLIEIVPSDENYILQKLKVYLLNASENLIECGEIDNRLDCTEKDSRNLSLSLTRQIILYKKSEYLINDELTLLCECTFSTGIEFEKIEEAKLELPKLVLKQNRENTSDKNAYNVTEMLSACNSVSEDMKAIYVDQCLTDVELKTKTKTFRSHKIVLCARSSVFKAMLTNDMKEKNTGCIQVADLENDTVQQLLLFLYSDNLENLQWESAIKLYYAGDKYAVGKLKVLCSSFLVDNVTTSTAAELLLLADTHNDSNLKNAAEDFILKHYEQIIDSDEWKKLEIANSQLVIKTMYLMLKSKNGGK